MIPTVCLPVAKTERKNITCLFTNVFIKMVQIFFGKENKKNQIKENQNQLKKIKKIQSNLKIEPN